MDDLYSLELADSIYWKPPVKFCLAYVARVTVSLTPIRHYSVREINASKHQMALRTARGFVIFFGSGLRIDALSQSS